MPQRAIDFVLPSWAQRGAPHRLGVCEDKLLLPLLILGWGWARVIGLNPTNCQKAVPKPGQHI